MVRDDLVAVFGMSGAAFGDDDGNWHGLSLDFRKGKVYARGSVSYTHLDVYKRQP